MSIFIIAEVGVNHNGDIEIAKQMIDEAKKAGADCVKFQTFKGEEFVSDPKQTYTYKSQGEEVTESMLEMFKRYEFNKDEWIELIDYCKKREIVFSSTAQNISDLDFLLSITDLPFIKIGSDDLTNLEQMKNYASREIPIILSAGMAYASEIEDAVRTIRSTGNEQITVLHCVSSYPTEAKEVNLKKINSIQNAFNVKVGFSDHTIGSAAAVGSVCFGVTVIEKHFTLANDMSGPDHWFSINPTELKQYIDDIRFIEQAIGSAELKPTENELKVKEIARRKIVARVDIKQGDKITKEHIDYMRIDDTKHRGIEPKNFIFIENRVANRDIKQSETITLDILK